MLAYIKGTLEMKMTGYIVIDVGGLGYKVFMSESAIDKLGNIGENVKVHTYYKVREDDISIFGFNSLEELRMFELLISVSGRGAKTAIAMLDVCEPTEFALAIISEDVKTLTQIPGIGAKSAQRIILELKDKMKKEQQIQELTKATKIIHIKKQEKKKNINMVDYRIQKMVYLDKYNNFSIEFAALTYKNPELNRYAYRLQNFVEFLPYPHLIATLFNGCAFGPPLPFTATSTWTWVDHPVSGLPGLTLRAGNTCFHFGSVP